MKVYLCSIGEITTDICREQLMRYGFEVVLLDGKERWVDKYKKFINLANEDCIRIDADVIPNKNIRLIPNQDCEGKLMECFKCFDFYKNDIGVAGPVYYTKEVLEIIRNNIDKIGESRPETDASRLPEINPFYSVSDLVVGMHGFGQDDETLKRAMINKADRGQIRDYDFDLAIALRQL